MNVEKCKKCHWYYFYSKSPFHCIYCLLQGNQSAFKQLVKNDTEHQQYRNFNGEYVDGFFNAKEV